MKTSSLHSKGSFTALVSLLCLVTFCSEARARIVVSFGVDSIVVKQRAGVIQVPVNIDGSPSPGTFDPPRMSYTTQPGSAQFRVHYSYNTDLWGGGSITYREGDARTKYLTFAILFTESVQDRTFTIYLEPDATGFPSYKTRDADAGNPSFVTVTILGVSQTYLNLKNSIRRLNSQIAATSRIKDARKRALKIRSLKRIKARLQAHLNRAV
jgi:hypothetical protein